jgi:hypothetical protein
MFLLLHLMVSFEVFYELQEDHDNLHLHRLKMIGKNCLIIDENLDNLHYVDLFALYFFELVLKNDALQVVYD